MSGWQPQQYGQRQQGPATTPQWGQDPPPGYRPPPWPPQENQPAPQQQWQQPQWQQQSPYPGSQYQRPQQYAAPRKKRRVFLWVFLAVQALFIIWIIAGVAGTSHSGTDAHAQAAQWCSVKSNWQYLYKSQADCVTHYGNALNGASDVGKSLGVGLIVVFWVVADFFLGVGYVIYRLASRPR